MTTFVSNNITPQQLKLLKRWRGDSKFFNKLSEVSQDNIQLCVSSKEYTEIQRTKLQYIRMLWIEELTERSKWVQLTRKLKHLISQSLLVNAGPTSFRESLNEEELNFLKTSINDGKYLKKDSYIWEQILLKHSTYDEVPF